MFNVNNYIPNDRNESTSKKSSIRTLSKFKDAQSKFLKSVTARLTVAQVLLWPLIQILDANLRTGSNTEKGTN